MQFVIPKSLTLTLDLDVRPKKNIANGKVAPPVTSWFGSISVQLSPSPHGCKLYCATCNEYEKVVKAWQFTPNWLTTDVTGPGIVILSSIQFGNCVLWNSDHKPEGYALDAFEFAGVGGPLLGICSPEGGFLEMLPMPTITKGSRIRGEVRLASPEALGKSGKLRLSMTFAERNLAEA